MSTKAVKIAISLPKEDFKLLETLRKRIGISRSALIYRAIHYWLAKKEEEEKVKQYIEGWRKNPLSPQEIKELIVMEKVQAETMSKEDWS